MSIFFKQKLLNMICFQLTDNRNIQQVKPNIK